MSDKERSRLVTILSLIRDIKWQIKYNEDDARSKFMDEIYKKIRELEKITQGIIYEDVLIKEDQNV